MILKWIDYYSVFLGGHNVISGSCQVEEGGRRQGQTEYAMWEGLNL